eukprot:Mrub_00355.p1 GENE.Mrub_00355~~Mrub_00355.p1  ORF type:complete len:1161 (+),score=270.43 Mrub_00355:446-3484(+)
MEANYNTINQKFTALLNSSYDTSSKNNTRENNLSSKTPSSISANYTCDFNKSIKALNDEWIEYKKSALYINKSNLNIKDQCEYPYSDDIDIDDDNDSLIVKHENCSITSKISISTVTNVVQSYNQSDDFNELNKHLITCSNIGSENKSDYNELDIAHNSIYTNKECSFQYIHDQNVLEKDYTKLYNQLSDPVNHFKLRENIQDFLREIEEYIEYKTGLIRKIEDTDKKLNSMVKENVDKMQYSLKEIKSIHEKNKLCHSSDKNLFDNVENKNTNIINNRFNSEFSKKSVNNIISNSNDNNKNLSDLITVNKEKYTNLVNELKELKKIKSELTSRINSNETSYKLMEKTKNREISKLNKNLSGREKKINSIENNLFQVHDALKERKQQYKEIKNCISNNVTLINETCKLSKNAQNELAKNKTAKENILYIKLSRDIENLTLKKDSLLKVTKELECKDKILSIRENIIGKYKNLKKRAEILNFEYLHSINAFEQNIDTCRNEINHFEYLKSQTTNEDDKRKFNEEIESRQAIHSELQTEIKNMENQLELEKSAINSQIQQYDLQLEGYALDDQKRDSDIDKLLEHTVNQVVISSIEQVESLPEHDLKTHLKYFISENAHLATKAQILQNQIQSLQSKIQNNEYEIINLNSKLSMFKLPDEEENHCIPFKSSDSRKILNRIFKMKDDLYQDEENQKNLNKSYYNTSNKNKLTEPNLDIDNQDYTEEKTTKNKDINLKITPKKLFAESIPEEEIYDNKYNDIIKSEKTKNNPFNDNNKLYQSEGENQPIPNYLNHEKIISEKSNTNLLSNIQTNLSPLLMNKVNKFYVTKFKKQNQSTNNLNTNDSENSLNGSRNFNNQLRNKGSDKFINLGADLISKNTLNKIELGDQIGKSNSIEKIPEEINSIEKIPKPESYDSRPLIQKLTYEVNSSDENSLDSGFRSGSLSGSGSGSGTGTGTGTGTGKLGLESRSVSSLLTKLSQNSSNQKYFKVKSTFFKDLLQIKNDFKMFKNKEGIK